MADVLSVLRELRSLEQKKETGSLTPEESARFADLQSSLSRPPSSPGPTDVTATEEVPFVEADLQDESAAAAPSAFDGVPQLDEPLYATPAPAPAVEPGIEPTAEPIAAPAPSSGATLPFGAFGPVDAERTVVERAPAVSMPPQRKTMTWGMPAVIAPPPPELPTDTPASSPPVAMRPMPSAWQDAVSPSQPPLPPSPSAAPPDDAPAVWPTVPASSPFAVSAPDSMVDSDATQDVTAIASVPPLEAPAPPRGMLFQWPAPSAAPAPGSFEATPIEEADLEEIAEPPPPAPSTPAAAPAFAPAFAPIDLPSLDPEIPETDDDAQERTVVSARPPFPGYGEVSAASPPSVTLPPLPAPPPLAPPPLAPPPMPPPPMSAPAEPAWSGRAAGARPLVRGEARVVVHTLEGVQKRGTLRDADLSQSPLTLQLLDGQTEVLPIEKLKVIFFMVPIGQPVPKPEGTPVTVVLQDGRQLEGLSPDYRPGAQGFFLCPLDQRSRAARIYVYPAAVKEIL